MIRFRALAVGAALVVSLAAAGVSALGDPLARAAVPLSSYVCQGAQITLFDNTNPYLVGNGGTPPQFSTNNKAYCLTYIQTYHWNDGKGGLLGGLELERVSGPPGLPPRTGYIPSKGSSGQNGVANANAYVDVPTSPPTIIDGVYRCLDTIRGSWSQNAQSGGGGFCIVYATPAVAPGSSTGTTTTTTPSNSSSSTSSYAVWVWLGVIAAVLFGAALIYVALRRPKIPKIPLASPDPDPPAPGDADEDGTEEGTTEQGTEPDGGGGDPTPPPSSGQDFAPGGD